MECFTQEFSNKLLNQNPFHVHVLSFRLYLEGLHVLGQIAHFFSNSCLGLAHPLDEFDV